MYNYLEEMEMSIEEWIGYEIDLEEYEGRRDELEEKLNDDLWANDCITGNGSGSYTFCSATAKEYVLENVDLLREAYTEFDCKETLGDDFCNEEWEKMDVTIRCYLLGQAINNTLDKMGIF